MSQAYHFIRAKLNDWMAYLSVYLVGQGQIWICNLEGAMNMDFLSGGDINNSTNVHQTIF